MSPLSWLRRRVAETVMAGISDACAALANANEGDHDQDPDSLLAVAGRRLERALPAPQEDEPARKKR